MRVELQRYTSKESGIALRLIPETDVEDKLLITMFTQGELTTGHPGGQKGTHSYIIRWDSSSEEA